MREIVFKLVTFAAVLLFIFGIFWGVKRQSWITIEQLDHAMDPEYSAGTYHISPQPLSQAELTVGKAYAFMVPNGEERERRVAWMVAKEGQRIEFKEKGVYVDGAKSECKIYLGRQTLAPFVVPRGTVYMLSITPEKDSLSRGPIPFRNVLGQM